MFLIEAWDDKTPAESELGSVAAVAELRVEGPGDGHVPRNARIVYALADLAAPYVHVTQAALRLAPGGASESARALRLQLQGERILRLAAHANAEAAAAGLPGLLAAKVRAAAHLCGRCGASEATCLRRCPPRRPPRRS